jgi:glycosyltransferase involved in cell wall biosynthesis
MNPRYSVVIPAYRAGRTIEATLRSVYLQTTHDFDVAIVDDGSPDDTVERARTLADERVTVLHQEHLGPSAARNLAIASTHGEYVCPLDADDLLLPHFLETMGAALDRNPDAGFAYTDAWTLDDVTGRIRRASAKAYQRPPTPAPTDRRAFFRELLDRNFVLCCVLIRRSVLEEVGGDDVRISGSEDWELWLRVVASGWSAVEVPGRLAVYREGQPASNSGDPLKMSRSVGAVYDLVAADERVDEADRARAVAYRASVRDLEHAIVDPSPRGPRDRVLDPLKRLRRRVLATVIGWHRSPPPPVRDLLQRTGAVARR